MWKKLKKVLLLLVVLLTVSLFCRACFAKPQLQVIAEFKMNREAFETVRDCYFVDGWEKVHSTILFSNMQDAPQHVRPPVRKYLVLSADTSQLDKSLDRLFGLPGYFHVIRTSVSKNTIVFEQNMKIRLATGRFIIQWVAYSMDGKIATPRYNGDIWVEMVEPIGDNWYYWRGSQYPY